MAGCLSGADLLDHPAINYGHAAVHDPVASLDPKQLKFDGHSGYLNSVLDALHVPVESQIAVFSKTSLQAPLIEPNNPRTIFFNDSVAVGWMKGGFIEIAALDPRQGVQFYKLEQHPSSSPRFVRGSPTECLRCHVGESTLGVAGMLVRSTYTAADGSPMLIYGGSLVDHRTPIEDRWGGWFVTGSVGTVHHLGNAVIGPQGDPNAMEPVQTKGGGKADSDVTALMVFDHQMHMANLITRIGWDARVGVGKLEDEAREFVDYLLFVDEAPLPGKLDGKFAEVFAKNAVRDSKGRSLRDLDLRKRLLRYPCSYMIYSDAFNALPAEAKDVIYKRMLRVLSGSEKGKKYARLSAADRRAVLEILRETKPDFPKPDFGRVVN